MRLGGQPIWGVTPADPMGTTVRRISGTGGDLRRKPNIFQSQLAKHVEILAYDQRGLGQTSRPDIPYTMADYADDAVALLDAVGWDECAMMGVSFGGMVGAELLIRYPGRITRAVLACTSSGGAGKPSYPLHTLAGLPPEERAQRVMTLSDTRLDAAWQEANPTEFQAMLTMAVHGQAIGADEPNREIGARRQVEARADHDVYDRMPQITVPIYICGGNYDGIAPLENQTAMQAQLPDARMELFEGGHQFLNQDPLAYQRVIAFLQEKF